MADAFSPFANLNVRIGSDISDFQKAADKMERALKPIRDRLNKLGKTLTVGVTAPIVALGAKSVAAWDKQAKAVAKVENLIRSTGGAAGKTLQELESIASGLQENTLFGDEEILDKATAQLLTFTNIAGDQFERTQAVALDLATVLSGDLQGASISLGKALNDPVANLSALSRSGIQFSESQKEVINALVESGQLAEAQNVILAELERQYGGAAAAAAQAGTGPFTQLGNTIGDITERIGKVITNALLPLVGHLKEAGNWFNSLSDEAVTTITTIGAIAAAIGPLLLGLGSVLKLLPLVSAGFTLLTGPVGIIAAALGGAAILIFKNWDSLKGSLGDIWGSIKDLAVGFYNGLLAIWETLTAGAREIWDVWGADILAIGRFTFGALGDAVKTGLGLIADLFGALVDLVTGDWAGLWESLKSITVSITRFIARTVLRMADIILAGVNRVFSFIPGVESLIGTAREYIQGLISDLSTPVEVDLKLKTETDAAGAGGSGGAPIVPIPAAAGTETVARSEEITRAIEEIPKAWTAVEYSIPSTLTLPGVDATELKTALDSIGESVQYSFSAVEKIFIRSHARLQEVVPQIADTIKSGFADAAAGMLEGIGQMLVGAESAGGVVRSIMGTLADLAIRVGKIAIAVGIGVEGIRKALQTLNPFVAIAAGAALIALGAAAKSALSGAAGSGGGSSGAGLSGGFGNQSLSVNGNQLQPVPVRQSREDVRVVLESKTTAAGNVVYSVKKGTERLDRRGTDEI